MINFWFTDDSLVHTSSQNEIKTEKEEVKTFIELSAKGKSIVLGKKLKKFSKEFQ